MRFLWGKTVSERNNLLVFSIDLIKPCDTLKLCAVDFFRVFADGKLLSFGPNRTAAGYARTRVLSVSGVKKLSVEVLSYGVFCYSCDFQTPFFGAELFCGGKLVYDACDFKCFKNLSHKENMPRYSGQRGFVECVDLTKCSLLPVETFAVSAPVILGDRQDIADYLTLNFEKKGETYPFSGFNEIRYPNFEQKDCEKLVGAFNTAIDFIKETESGYFCADYELSSERSGFIGLKIRAESMAKIFCVFDEILINGKWIFRRSGCNDYVVATVPKGEHEILFFEPYGLKYLKIIFNGDAEITPYFITIENGVADCVKVGGDADFVKVFDAALSTYKQNALDIFMDCPTRERAGWLCDSYFMGYAEKMFSGNNLIEKDFLENIFLADTPEIPKGMIPKCFPSEHKNGLYIPNWAMWFALEIYEYFRRSGDGDLVAKVKNKIYDSIKFFDRFVNEFGLLENLESWVFIEWSICNDAKYLEGVNFPSNMLFALTLDRVGDLYGDKALKERAKNMRENIVKLSFNGRFFVDNATRKNGKLSACGDHISETCQYYALFSEICPSDEFANTVIKEFGPLRTDKYPEIGRSNMFIGNYLRFFILSEKKEYDRIVKESLSYFAKMADGTGTLWERDAPYASCNHGFASVIAVLLLRAETGYDTVRDGKPVFLQDFGKDKSSITVEFNYKYN